MLSGVALGEDLYLRTTRGLRERWAGAYDTLMIKRRAAKIEGVDQPTVPGSLNGLPHGEFPIGLMKKL
jgi:hypothetical protein